MYELWMILLSILENKGNTNGWKIFTFCIANSVLFFYRFKESRYFSRIIALIL